MSHPQRMLGPPSEGVPQLPTSNTPWVILGVGAILAILGAGALVAALYLTL